MDPTENAIEENRRLRRTMRDLVALSTLPAVWTGLGPEGIARSLADVLFATLSLDLIYIRLPGLPNEGGIEVVRGKHGPGGANDKVVTAAVAPLLSDDLTGLPTTIPDPFGPGTLNIVVTRFGIGGDEGVLVAGSRNSHFPHEQDRLLLGVGANQTAIVVQRRRAEERVREQQELLRVTLASIGDAVIATDTQGRVTFLNGVAEGLTGWTQEEAEGKPLATVFVILNEQTRRPVENSMDKVLRSGTIAGLVNHTILVAKNGIERPIDDSAAPIKDGTGKMVGVVLTFRDVTAKREADRALREREQELRLVTDHAPAFLAHCDPEGRYKFVNKGYAERFGMAPRDLVGQRIPDVLGEEAYANIAPHVEAVLTGQPVEFEVEIPYERIGRHVIHAAYAPEFDTSGRVIGFVAVITDVTERKRAEDALQASEQRFSRFMQHLPGLAWIKDGQGRYVYVNDAAASAFGTPQAELYGKTDDDVFPPETAVRFKSNDARALSGGTIQVVEELEHDDGLVHYSLVCKFPLSESDGGVALVGGMAIDITDRKRAEEKVRHSEERFRSLMEQAPFSIQLFSPDGRTIRVNRAWEELWGVRFEQIDGYNVLEDRQLEARGVLQYIHQGFAGQPTRIPAIQYDPNATIPDVTKQDDPRRWLSAVIYPLKDTEGRVREVVLIHEDITARIRAEEKSRQSEAQSRTILESITDAFCALDQEWRFTYVNRQAELLLGRSRDDLIGKNHWDEYPDTLGTDVERNYRRAVAEAVTITFEVFYPPHDRWYECHAYPSPEGLSVYFRDVSERKRTELVLSDSEKRFRQLADAMPQIVWTARPDGNIDYLNQRWVEFSGQPPSVGNEAWGPIMHPDEAAHASERWANSVSTGSAFEMEMRLLDRRQRTYRWHLIRTVAIPDGDGKVARWFGTSTDIHEQKRAEEASRFLAAASAELAGLVDYESTLQKVANLAVPYFADWSAVDLVDDDGDLRRLAVAHEDAEKITLVRELMREYPPDPQSPVGVFAVLRSGKPELVGEITDEMLVRGAKDERHLQLIRSLGLKSYICVPMIASGKTLGLLTFATAESGRLYTESDLALAMDLSNRASVAVENTQLYQALRDADRRKDEFLATLAHELRNPLAPVRNALQILKMPRVDAQTIERSREMMERQVQHLVRLVDDLLDVSRVMRGKIELRKERIELAAVVARAVETVQPLVDAQGHELSVRISPESLLLDADPVRLAQVVGNLLTNAAKYTEQNGRIWLTAERDGEMAVLRVRDNGIGITTQMLPSIFELFVQVDHASTKAQGGLGIGLTLVKNLIEMHNGTVEARSEGLGKGSEFAVRLPVLPNKQDKDQGSQHVRQADRVPLLSGHRLLVVDDNQDAANSLAMLLKLQGHEVRVAFSGMGAVEMTKTYTPDVIFMDIGMPGMDGYEAARRIREQPGMGKVIMTALTGWGQQEDRRRTAEAGFNHHLVKPPEPEAVKAILDALSSKK